MIGCYCLIDRLLPDVTAVSAGEYAEARGADAHRVQPRLLPLLQQDLQEPAQQAVTHQSTAQTRVQAADSLHRRQPTVGTAVNFWMHLTAMLST